MKKIRFLPIWVFCLVSLLSTAVRAATTLVPVGTVIGLDLQDGTVTVASFDADAPAQAAGLQVGDRLISVDGSAVHTVEDIRRALERSDGTVDITVKRENETLQLQIHPRITGDGPKLGVYLRQGVTGIGTVTYYDPETGIFGTLGHGVNDPTGKLLTVRRGNAYPAAVSSVRKGRSGQPGQLVGTLSDKTRRGTFYRNTPQGVFGKTQQPFSGKAVPVASYKEVHTGKATILSTVQGNTPREYSVEIVKIYAAQRENGRNLLIRVTDPALLEATGGIVQGMSGSPIIQNGKLVGAVTHVLVNDPTTGYGIFIENMLNAAA